MIAFVLLRVLLILLLVAANAFFAAAEFALVSVRDTRIQQLIEARRIGARIVQKPPPQSGRSRERRPTRRNRRQPDPGLDRRADGGPNVLKVRFLDMSRMLGLRARDRHRHRFHPDHLPARHSGRTGAEVAGLQRAEQVALAVAAPMDVFLTLTRPFTVRHEPVGGWVSAGLRARAGCARARCIRPTNSN